MIVLVPFKKIYSFVTRRALKSICVLFLGLTNLFIIKYSSSMYIIYVLCPLLFFYNIYQWNESSESYNIHFFPFFINRLNTATLFFIHTWLLCTYNTPAVENISNFVIFMMKEYFILVILCHKLFICYRGNGEARSCVRA